MSPGGWLLAKREFVGPIMARADGFFSASPSLSITAFALHLLQSAWPRHLPTPLLTIFSKNVISKHLSTSSRNPPIRVGSAASTANTRLQFVALRLLNDYVEEILEDQKKNDDISKEGFAIRIISLYGKSGMFDQAYQTFDQLPEPKCQRTVKSFDALLTACVDTSTFDKAELLFCELPSCLSIQPNLY
ncbi:hypothetical protein NE237_033156 [Protea cynaroides]|uniref:Pentatricopeptide repeat-containing protein n=1 Tax=Protea cynaroides TaxID=273540 RepID=A0A9Q0R457_9MAGN|nr:hypothetical protein NE237_033156 [Protea cynaroides]